MAAVSRHTYSLIIECFFKFRETDKQEDQGESGATDANKEQTTTESEQAQEVKKVP